MDLLDTFGDWVQMLFVAAMVFGLTTWISILGPIVSYLAAATVVWFSWDYDVYLGLYIGAGLHFLMANSYIKKGRAMSYAPRIARNTCVVLAVLLTLKIMSL